MRRERHGALVCTRAREVHPPGSQKRYCKSLLSCLGFKMAFRQFLVLS